MSRILVTFLVVAASYSPSFSQTPSEVRVRVLDYRNALPARGRKVGLVVAPANAKNDNWLIAKTNRDGVASFRISGSLRQTLRVDPEAGSLANWSCTRSNAEFDFSGVLDLETSEVLQHGVVGELTNHPLCQHHTSSTLTARPGEIVVYTRHLNPWLTVRRFMHEVFNG
jgi:hypothetical protein